MKKLLLALLFISATTQLTFADYPQDQYAMPVYPNCNIEKCEQDENDADENNADDITEHPVATGIKFAIISKILLSTFHCIKGTSTDIDQVFLLSVGLAAITSLILPSFLKISKKQQKCDYYAKSFVIVGCLCSEYLRWSDFRYPNSKN